MTGYRACHAADTRAAAIPAARRVPRAGTIRGHRGWQAGTGQLREQTLQLSFGQPCLHDLLFAALRGRYLPG
jgi:hypothetical protein